MNVRDYLTRIQSDAAAALNLLPPDPGVPTTVVKAGDNLQAALDNGGSLSLEDGATWNGCYVAKKPGTRVLGPKSAIQGTTAGAAIFIPPGSKDIQIVLGTAGTKHPDSVILVGAGDATQKTLDAVPDGILLTINVPTHRGKRAFQINGSNVTLQNCNAYDTYDPGGQDSQGVLIWNTPGPVTVTGGTFEAGSECILVGGDPTAIPDVVPSRLTFDTVNLTRPLSWMTDGIKRKIKNNFELKAGVNVILRNSVLKTCFIDGQVGFALMLTPRDGKAIQHVLIENCQASDVGNFMNVLGYDNGAYSPQTVDIVTRGCTATTRNDSNFGTGRFMQWQASPAQLMVDGCTFNAPIPNGDVAPCQAFYANPGKIWTDPTTPGNGTTMQGIKIVNNRINLRSYGFQLNGNAYGANWQQAWPDGVISGNTFFGETAISHKRNLPADNVYQA